MPIPGGSSGGGGAPSAGSVGSSQILDGGVHLVDLAAEVTATALGGVPTSRTIAGLSLASNRSAADIKTALAITSSDVSGLGNAATKNTGTTAGTVAAGDDSRLSDSRTPLAHASSHASAGSDPITAVSIGASYPNSGLDSARPSAATGIIGQLYYATDSGTVYACLSNGSGGALWRVWGKIGSEGLDTTSVIMGGTVGARGLGNATIAAATAVSFAVIFAEVSTPSGVSVIAIFGPHQFEIGNDSGDRHQLSLYVHGVGTNRVSLGTISGSPTTRHCMACTTSGFTTTWSLDGSAAATASHVSGSPSGTSALAFSSSTWPAPIYLSSLVIWGTAIGNSDLATVSGAYASGRIPPVSGATETIRYHAQQYTAGVLNQQIYTGTAAGTQVLWTNGFPLTSRSS